MYRMILRSVGNPDYRQNPNRPISPTEIIEFAAIEEAGPALRSYVERHDLGSGNVPRTAVLEGDREVARVSYNGRVWLAPMSLPNAEDLSCDWQLWRPIAEVSIEEEQGRQNMSGG